MPSLSELYLRFTFDLVAREAFEHLHWGYFRDVPRDPRALPAAQQAFAELLVSLVPANAHAIADVGCGLGGISRMLVARGAKVTAISPRADHCAAIERAGIADLEVRCARFEDLAPAGDRDLLVFAESLNFFVHQDAERAQASVDALAERCRAWLAPGGGLLLCDLVAPPLAAALERAPGFAVRECIDVTDDVAFTAEALQGLVDRYVRPYHELVLDVAGQSDPALRTALERTFASVDNVSLRALLHEGRMIEHDMLDGRRYKVWRLQRV